MDNLFKVSARSRAVSLAGAIAGTIRDGQPVSLQAIGAGSVNQAVKAIIIARAYLAGDNLDIVCVPEFVELAIDGHERTALRFHVDLSGKLFPPAKSAHAREVSVDAPALEPASSRNAS